MWSQRPGRLPQVAAASGQARAEERHPEVHHAAGSGAPAGGGRPSPPRIAVSSRVGRRPALGALFKQTREKSHHEARKGFDIDINGGPLAGGEAPGGTRSRRQARPRRAAFPQSESGRVWKESRPSRTPSGTFLCGGERFREHLSMGRGLRFPTNTCRKLLVVLAEPPKISRNREIYGKSI